MDDNFFYELEQCFTKARFSVYKQDGASNVIALARYLYNIELCKALYAVLNVFEITFRNKIDEALKTFAQQDNWYDSIQLDKSSMIKIGDAKNKIKKRGKEPTHDRIIAELTLGFWSSLLTTRYSQSKFQSHIIRSCFQKCPKSEKSIKNIQKRFDKIRILRNRVSHYERIIHWKDLEEQHAHLLECINWLDEAAYALIGKIDRFEHVYLEGLFPFVSLVEENWNTLNRTP